MKLNTGTNERKFVLNILIRVMRLQTNDNYQKVRFFDAFLMTIV